jgi:organic hydroperoxide reductase OsmC/OhrA
VADVEGNIEDREGVLKITTIRIRYAFKIPAGTRDKAERAVALYAEKCPAYQTVKDCIDISWQADMTEG